MLGKDAWRLPRLAEVMEGEILQEKNDHEDIEEKSRETLRDD